MRLLSTSTTWNNLGDVDVAHHKENGLMDRSCQLVIEDEK